MEIIGNGWKLLKKAGHCWKWVEKAINSWKWLENVLILLDYLCNMGFLGTWYIYALRDFCLLFSFFKFKLTSRPWLEPQMRVCYRLGCLVKFRVYCCHLSRLWRCSSMFLVTRVFSTRGEDLPSEIIWSTPKPKIVPSACFELWMVHLWYFKWDFVINLNPPLFIYAKSS